MSSPKRAPRVLHVYLEDRGGGPRHVLLLREALGTSVEWNEISVPPGLMAWPRCIRRIREQIRRTNIELIHAHGVRAAALAAWGARRAGVGLVVTIHGLHLIRRVRPLAAPVARTVNRMVLGRYGRVLVLSRNDERAIEALKLAPSTSVSFVTAGVKPPTLHSSPGSRATFELEDEDLVVLWLGRFSREKDPGTFIRSIAAIDNERVVALMAGDGPLMADLTDLAHELGIDRRVRFVGWLDDPAPAFGAADIYVNSSRWETVPLAALEAASAALPLVLSDCPGNRDLLDLGVPAKTFDVGAHQGLATALGELVADPAIRRVMGDRASRVVATAFSFERLAEDVKRVYSDVLG